MPHRVLGATSGFSKSASYFRVDIMKSQKRIYLHSLYILNFLKWPFNNVQFNADNK